LKVEKSSILMSSHPGTGSRWEKDLQTCGLGFDK